MNEMPKIWRWRPWVCMTVLGLAVFGCTPVVYQTPPPPPAPRALAPAPPPARPVFFVNANRLNLRACPGYDCPKVAILERNETVEKLGESEDWSQVRVKKDGTLGWVVTRFLSSGPQEAPAAAPPLPTPPPASPAPPATAQPERPPLPEKPAVPKPPETATPATKKKPGEETKETKPKETKPKAAKPAEAAEPTSPKPAAKPAPEKAKPPEEKKEKAPAPAPEPAPEQKKGIRIM